MSTFIEELKALPPDRMVYVGMKSGAAWVAIETAPTFIEKMDKLERMVKSLTEDSLSSNTHRIKVLAFDTLPRYEKRISGLKEQLETLETLPVDIFAGGYKEKKEKVEEKKKELSTTLENYDCFKKELRDKINKIISLQEYLRNYVPVAQRIVEDSYIHKTQPMGNAFLLEGNEHGTLWMYEERTPL